MPIGATTLSGITGPGFGQAGTSVAKPQLLDDEDRKRLGLPPAGQVGVPPKKETLDGTPNGLGKDDFLKLLLAQMTNQDPLKPMEDKEFISQLAQFNSLEQAQQSNKHLVDMITSQSIAEATSLIGKQVVAKGDKGDEVKGQVTAVTMVSGQPKLLVGTIPIALANVGTVLEAEEASTSAPDEMPDATEGGGTGTSTNASSGSSTGTGTGMTPSTSTQP